MAFAESWLKSYRRFVEWLEVKLSPGAQKNFYELEQMAVEEWKNISEDSCADLVNNCRKILLEVTKMESHAKY